MRITRKKYINNKNAYGVISFFIYITLGKPEVDSQSKKDAHVQTNELVVEKDGKGMSCLFKSSLWFLGGWLLVWVPYSMQVRSLRRVIAKLKKNHMILDFSCL